MCDDVIKTLCFSLWPQLRYRAVPRMISTDRLNLPSSLPAQVTDIVQHLAVPDLFTDSLRYAGIGSGSPSTSVTLKQEFELNWAGSPTQLAADEQQVVLTRNPFAAVLYLRPFVNLFTYQIQTAGGAGSFTCAQSVPTDCFGGSAVAQGGSDTPHGQVLYPWRGAGKMGYWLDYDGTTALMGMLVTFDLPALTSTTIVFWYWTGASWAIAAVEVGNGVDTQYRYRPPAPGRYVYAQVICTAQTLVATVTVYGAPVPPATCTVVSHNPVPDADQLLQVAQGIRVLGAAMLLRNESNELNENGKILAVQMPKSIPWVNVFSGTNTIAQEKGYWSGLAKTGYYGFLRPDDADDFAYSKDVQWQLQPQLATFQSASTPLKGRSPYLTASIAVAGDVSTQNFSLVVWHIVEYMTNSKLQPSTFTDKTEEQWRLAIEFMRTMSQHYENPIHIDSIMAAIGKYGGPLSSIATTIMKAFPQTAAIGEALGNELPGQFNKLWMRAAGNQGMMMNQQQRKRGRRG